MRFNRTLSLLAVAAASLSLVACSAPDDVPSQAVQDSYRSTYDRNNDGRDDNTGELITAALIGYAIAGGFNGGQRQVVNQYYHPSPTVHYVTNYRPPARTTSTTTTTTKRGLFGGSKTTTTTTVSRPSTYSGSTYRSTVSTYRPTSTYRSYSGGSSYRTSSFRSSSSFRR